MLLTIKLIVFGVVSIVMGISMLANGWGHSLVRFGAIPFGILLIVAGVRRILVPASVGGGSSQVTSSEATPTATATESDSAIEKVSMFGNERRVILPHDSLPPLPFKM